MKIIFLVCFLGVILLGCSDPPKKKSEVLKKEATIEGTYVSKDNSFYKSLTFKGKSTVVIKDAIFQMDFVTSYEKDEKFIRIKTDKSDLLLEWKTADTLVGEGFAKGHFVKK